MENQIKNCPMCPRNCPIDSPNCDRGEAFAKQVAEDPAKAMEMLQMQKGEHRRGHGHGEGHHGHGGHGHGIDPDPIPGLLRRCGHILHHGSADPNHIAAALTETEQEQLKELLKKLLSGLD